MVSVLEILLVVVSSVSLVGVRFLKKQNKNELIYNFPLLFRALSF